MPKENAILAGHRFCGWMNRAALNEACTMIINLELFQHNKFTLIEGMEVEEMKFYGVKACILSTNSLVGACKCPTEPPLYIVNKESEIDLNSVIISHPGFIYEKAMRRQLQSGDGTGCCGRGFCTCCSDDGCCNEERRDEIGECLGDCTECCCICLGKIICCPIKLAIDVVDCAVCCGCCIICCPCIFCGCMDAPQPYFMSRLDHY